MLRRREFLQRAAVASALLGVSLARAERVFAQQSPALPPRELYLTDPERYWSALRRQWVLAADHINLNCGSLGCTPLPVVRAMVEHIVHAEEYREPGYPWFGYEESPVLRELRDALAGFLHVQRDELALVRNATEGNNVVANGLDLKPSEEVLLTDQEHPGGRCPWEQKAARYGIKLNYVSLPKPPASNEEIVELFARAITPATRVVFFSHITSPTGLLLPAKQICQLARQRGVLTQVDGAHAIGQIPLDLHDMGCDFYITSPHKWLLAPKGTGTLYIREELLERVWVTIASGDWRNYALKAYRFSNVGTSNLSVMVGLKAALDFCRAVGEERIYARIHQLATQVRERIGSYRQFRLANASRDAFYGGMVSFEPLTGDLKRVADQCAARRIRIGGGGERIRISTHIFTLPAELDAFFDALAAGLRSEP